MSKTNKTSLYKGIPVIRLEKSKKDSESLSAAINRNIERYQHICKADMPELSMEELTIIGSCMVGTFIDPLMVEYMHQEIEDYDDLVQKPVYYPELVEKISNMSIGQRYAVLEALKL